MEDGKILVPRSPTKGLEPVDAATLQMSTKMHIVDVRNGLLYLIGKLHAAADLHDHTKLEFFNEFLNEYNQAANDPRKKWPTGPNTWFEGYHLLERHHLNDKVPDNVNLIDVLEMLVDCVMAGMARKGEYKASHEPDPELLLKAYRNTVEQLINNIKVVDNIEQARPKMVSLPGFNFKVTPYEDDRSAPTATKH